MVWCVVVCGEVWCDVVRWRDVTWWCDVMVRRGVAWCGVVVRRGGEA